MSRGNQRQLRALPATGRTEEQATVEEVSRILGTAPVAATRQRKSHFSLTEVSYTVRTMAVLFGVFLSYAVLRIQELYPVLAVPKLPFIMALLVALTALLAVPFEGWRRILAAAPSIKWQAPIVILGFLTAPIGIWMSGSLTTYFLVYSVSVIVFIATVVFLRDRKAMAATIGVLLLTSAVNASYTLSDSARTVGKSDRVKLGVSLDPNDLAMLFVAMVPLALWMAQRKGPRSVGWTVIAVLMALAIVPTQSRGAILGLGAVAVTLIALGQSGWKRTLYMLGAAGLAIGIFALANATGADRLSNFSDYSGGESRTAIWKRGLVWMTWRPWGYGMENFPIFFGWMNGRDRAAHNSFIQIGVELGVLGLAAFVLLWAHTARDLVRQRRHAMSLVGREPGASHEVTLATMMLAAMAGTAGCGFFLSKAYAGITLFVQGLGIATLIGYPYRDARPQVTAPAGPEQQAGRRRRLGPPGRSVPTAPAPTAHPAATTPRRPRR